MHIFKIKIHFNTLTATATATTAATTATTTTISHAKAVVSPTAAKTTPAAAAGHRVGVIHVFLANGRSNVTGANTITGTTTTTEQFCF